MATKKLLFDNTKTYKPVGSLIAIREAIENKTMLAETGLKKLYEFAIMARMLDGDVADAGVWEGGSTYLLASVLNNKTIHAFDSWEGLPAPTKEDFEGLDEQPMVEGWGKCDPPFELLFKFGDRIKFHIGRFIHTFHFVTDKKFCLVHIDCDQYESVKQCLEFFYPRMVEGGFIILDDYSFRLTPGATKATDEFFEDKLNEIEYIRHGSLCIKVNKDGGCQCLSGK